MKKIATKSRTLHFKRRLDSFVGFCSTVADAFIDARFVFSHAAKNCYSVTVADCLPKYFISKVF